MVWVKSSIRRCYQVRTNDVRYSVITVQYFSLLFHLHFYKFPDWFGALAVDPQPFVSRLGQYPCSAKLGLWPQRNRSHVAMVLLPTEEKINGSFWKSLLNRAVLKTMAYYSEPGGLPLSAHKKSAASLLPNFRSSSGSSVRGSAPPSLPFFLPPCRCRSHCGVSDQSLVTPLWRMLEVANSQLSSFLALCRRRAGPRPEMTSSRHLKGSNTDFWRPFLR
jgi:hypothetical protein